MIDEKVEEIKLGDDRTEMPPVRRPRRAARRHLEKEALQRSILMKIADEEVSGARRHSPWA